MANKFYAVKIGKTPGIYTSWEECQANVTGYPGAIYKSFKTSEEAQSFIDGVLPETKKEKPPVITEDVYSFVDGSFNPETNVYGCGGFLYINGDKHILIASDDDEEMASMRNVAGEILGSMLAIKQAIHFGCKEITIYYDYLGIEMWATGEWKANKKGTIAYQNFIKKSREKIDIKFKKVKGHSGIEGNEEADRLAKESVGII